MKTAKQNRTRQTRYERMQNERPRRILSYERQNWTDSKRSQHVSLKLPACCTPFIVTRAEHRALRCNRTACATANMLRACTNELDQVCAFGLLRIPVRFDFRSLRKPVCRVRVRSRVRTGFVRALSALSLNYSIMLCANWVLVGEGDGERGLQFRGYILEIYCFIWLSSPTGSSTRVEFYTILQCWRHRRRNSAFITPDNKVELRLPVRRMLDERVKSGDFNERENLHAWQMFIRCYK